MKYEIKGIYALVKPVYFDQVGSRYELIEYCNGEKILTELGDNPEEIDMWSMDEVSTKMVFSNQFKSIEDFNDFVDSYFAKISA